MYRYPESCQSCTVNGEERGIRVRIREGEELGGYLAGDGL